MSRYRWSLERGGDPAGGEGFGYVVALGVVLLMLVVATFVCAAEKDTRPVLWIYTDAKRCAPCRLLDKACEKAPMNQFRIVRLAPPDNTTFPCIYYRDADGDWQHFVGWGPGEEAKFLAQWKRDVGK